MQAPGFIKHPKHGIAITPTERDLCVHIADTVIAKSARVLVLNESRYDPVYYLPLEDIKSELICKSDTQTYCPFKGTASYWHLDIKQTIIEDALWAYEDPYDECLELKGYAAFYSTKVSLTIQDI